MNHQLTPDMGLIHTVSNGTIRHALKAELSNGAFYLATNDTETTPQASDPVNLCKYDQEHQELGTWRFDSTTEAQEFINNQERTTK